MVNAENISVPTALSGGGRCARIMRETFLSGPYINDAAEYVSVEALPGRPIEATISLRIRRAIASYTLVLVFLVETHARFRPGPQIPTIYRCGGVPAGRFK